MCPLCVTLTVWCSGARLGLVHTSALLSTSRPFCPSMRIRSCCDSNTVSNNVNYTAIEQSTRQSGGMSALEVAGSRTTFSGGLEVPSSEGTKLAVLSSCRNLPRWECKFARSSRSPAFTATGKAMCNMGGRLSVRRERALCTYWTER